MLAATAIPLPAYLVAVNDAAASTRNEAAAQAHAANRAQQRAEHRARQRAVRRHRHDRRAARTRKTAAAKHLAGTANDKSWKLTFPGTSASRATRVHANASARAAAGDPADTISDFKFTPGSLTIHVGDTVTWTNNGPTNHTATANDGSFNTGTLKKGQSASHTFTKAGTFAYICAIHSFMKGKIVVEASSASVTSPTTTASTPSSVSGSGSSTATASTPTATTPSATTPSATTSGTAAHSSTSSASSDSTLPNTGLDLTASGLAGLGLIACGLVLRRRVS